MVDLSDLLSRVSVLVEIADRKAGKGPRLGKTAMQKLLYLLQEGFDVDLGYRFGFYTYGPYEAAVMRDIDFAAELGMLKVEYDPDTGYQIAPGESAGQLEPFRPQVLEQLGNRLDRLMEHFGGFNARELELRATLLYIKEDEPAVSDEELCARAHRLKPKYLMEEIQEAATQLRQIKLIAA